MMGARAAAVALLLIAASAATAGPRLRVDSDEYRKSWPLEAIGARAAYAEGFSGRGVRIAIVDCGLQSARRELMRNVSRESVDLVPRQAAPMVDRHGVLVADPLAAALDGSGMVGLAYNATVLEIRADVDGGLDGACAFRRSDLARALDYAADHKARIVILPLQAEHPLGEAFEAALSRLVNTGAVVVISAGNSHDDQPSWPARYAADARFAANLVVAGAATYYGQLADWSNRAGPTQARYVVAPGEWVLSDCGRKCRLASGTSFATPYVAGAIALMMEAYPQLSGPEAAERVLAAGRDAGAPGVDPVYGRGMLDLTRAFAAGAQAAGVRISVAETGG